MYVARVRENGSAFEILVAKPEGKIPFFEVLSIDGKILLK